MSTAGHYVGPVILASDEEAAKKLRVINIYKNEVYKDIDLYTHKHVDGNDTFSSPYNRKQITFSPQVQNARSSDTSENVDGAVIARYVEFRDAQLRNRIQFALSDKVVDKYADDDISLRDNMYHYYLMVPEGFNDNTLRPLAEYIHRFLVFGALYDWYSQFGDGQAEYYGDQLPMLEEQINSALRGPSIVRRPMQPFGPAYKFK